MGYKLRAAGNAAAAAAAAAALHVQTTKGNVLLIPHVFSAGTMFSGSVSPAAWPLAGYPARFLPRLQSTSLASPSGQRLFQLFYFFSITHYLNVRRCVRRQQLQAHAHHCPRRACHAADPLPVTVFQHPLSVLVTLLARHRPGPRRNLEKTIAQLHIWNSE